MKERRARRHGAEPCSAAWPAPKPASVMAEVLTEVISGPVDDPVIVGPVETFPHLTDGLEFKSDKYPWCRAGFVALKLTDAAAQAALPIYISEAWHLLEPARRSCAI